MPLACYHIAACPSVRTMPFASSRILYSSCAERRHTAPNFNFSRPGAFPTDCQKRVCSTSCSVTDWCDCPARGSSMYWSCSFGGNNSHLSISSFLVMVFACFPTLSVRACMVTPVHGLVNFAALQTSAPCRLFRQSFHILSFAL